MRKSIIFIYLLVVLSAICNAQTRSTQKSPFLTEASPESVGICPERLKGIEEMCEQAVAEGHVPGIVSLIARDGKIVHWKAYGMADNEKKRVLRRDDIFRIASQTKAITSTAVMMLWEEGKFQLDDPVSKYIPEFKNPQVLNTFRYSDTTWTTIPAKYEITIRHLLTHTSGIGYGEIDRDERIKMIYRKAGITDLFTTENVTIKESVKKLAKLPLHHHPGEKYTYSEGLDVLGYLVEVVSEISFDKFLRTRIFEPLGMDDTYFYLPPEKAERLVTLQHKKEGKWTKYPDTFYDTDYPVKGAKTFFSGGAGLSSTAWDYALFLQMYLNGGEYNGVRLLSRTTVRSIMGNQTGDLFERAGNYHGLAFAIVNHEGQDMGGLGSAGTFYWGGYFNTQFFADPQENIIGIILKQTREEVNDDTRWRYKQMVFQAIDD
jgi:CubicO group peptidase (beta-lactamase class C family)